MYLDRDPMLPLIQEQGRRPLVWVLLNVSWSFKSEGIHRSSICLSKWFCVSVHTRSTVDHGRYCGHWQSYGRYATTCIILCISECPHSVGFSGTYQSCGPLTALYHVRCRSFEPLCLRYKLLILSQMMNDLCQRWLAATLGTVRLLCSGALRLSSSLKSVSSSMIRLLLYARLNIGMQLSLF
jgi:hypothetical protein